MLIDFFLIIFYPRSEGYSRYYRKKKHMGVIVSQIARNSIVYNIFCRLASKNIIKVRITGILSGESIEAREDQ